MASAGQVPGYRRLRLIGQGAHGQVHLAVHEASGLQVALKLVEIGTEAAAASQAAAFLASARNALRLAHPSIVAVRACGLHEGLGWLDMELVSGCDLSRYTQARRCLPEPVVLKLMARVARGLAQAHGLGVVPRDVKPANILVDWATDTVKLGDFGLARADDGLQTGTGIVLGSPSYMAPEQLAGARPSPRSDLYALGVTLFQLLTAQLPHDGASMGELLRRVATQRAPALRSLRPTDPPELERLIASLLAPTPGDRPADAAWLASELDVLAAAWPAPT